MAARLLQTHAVSDMCIGKPALRWLPPCSTVADAIAELEGGGRRGPDAAVAVWGGGEDDEVAGRVCMADVLLFLCSAGNLASPAVALQAALSDLLAAGAPPVRRVEPDARLHPRVPFLERHVRQGLIRSVWLYLGSVLEAVDAFLDGAHSLVVPVRGRRRAAAGGRDEPCMCWLTVEDVVRFFLSSIALFCPTASRSVSDLGVVRPPTLAVAAVDRALSAVPIVRAALASHTSVAVVSGLFPRRLAGEISPSALCSGDVSVAALSAGELMDWAGAPPDATLHALRCRLRRRNLVGMLDLLYLGCPSSTSSSSSSASSSSSSSDEDEEGSKTSSTPRRGNKLVVRRWYSEYPGRVVGRRPAAEAIVCRRRSSLVAVMVQAMSHRVTHVWVVEEEEDGYELVGVVALLDVLRVLRHHQPPPIF